MMQAFCKERKEACEREFDAVWKRLNGQDKKLWTIILLMVANLATLIGFIVNAVAR